MTRTSTHGFRPAHLTPSAAGREIGTSLLRRSLVILCVADGRRESAICRVPEQRASFRPAPPGDPSRCPSGDGELRP
jgi:hypothetical protein